MELRPKYYRRKKKVLIPEAPHIEEPTKWLHYPGVQVINQHHAVSRQYGTLDVFYEELDREDKIGYATHGWALHSEINKTWKIWVRTPLFYIWVYSPTLPHLNMNSGDIYASYAHLRTKPYRIVINRQHNPYNFGTIMHQQGKRIQYERGN